MKQGRKYALNLLLILVITVFAVWFAVKDNYEEVLRLISNIKWYYLVIIMAWGIVYTLVIDDLPGVRPALPQRLPLSSRRRRRFCRCVLFRYHAKCDRGTVCAGIYHEKTGNQGQ